MTSEGDWAPQTPHCRQHRALQVIFLAGPHQSAAQFGWWQACSVKGEVGPGWFLPSLRALLCIDAPPHLSFCSNVPLSSLSLQLLPSPSYHNYSHSPPVKPRDPAIAQLLKLSQEPVSLRPPPPPPSSPPPSPKSIPAWQTTWDFTSPLKSAASGNHSVQYFSIQGIRDWGGNQCCYIPPVSSWLLFLLMLCSRSQKSAFFSRDHNWSLIFPFIYIGGLFFPSLAISPLQTFTVEMSFTEVIFFLFEHIKASQQQYTNS